MRWLSSKEICEILGRFNKVILARDLILRYIIGSINILIYKDLRYSAVTNWNFLLQERYHWFYFLLNKKSANFILERSALAMSNSMSKLALFKESTRL
jgi:hypothetical protein